MAIGSFRGQLEGAISKRLTADPYEKRQQAAQADYQAQAEKARQDLSERLNRLGVLRGSGKTASQFGEFESGVLRGQQAIGAQFEAQRDAGVSQAIQQGIGMYGTTGQMGIAGRQQSEAERMGRFSRDLGTRQYLSQDALNRDRQREAERAAQVQEGFQRAGIVGQYDGQRTVDQQRQDLSYRLGLAQTFGTDLGGDDVTRQTEARAQRKQQELYQHAGLMGEWAGDRTLAAQQLYGTKHAARGAAQTMQQQELDLRRGELLGEVGPTGRVGEDRQRTLAAQLALGEIGSQDTLARDALQQEALQASMERGLRRTEGLAERNLRSSQASLDRRAASDMQAAQFGEAALEREARATEAGLGRDLAREELMGFREIDGRREQTLAAREAGAQRRLTEAEGRRERESREGMQQAQFGQETSQAALARTLAREELYGSANPMEWDRTLASTGQRAQIAAERRRLDEMETAGLSQRQIALAQQAEIERSALVREGFEGRRVGVTEAARRDQVAQERRRMALAEQEMYGGAEEISLDTLNIDPGLEMAVGRDTAIRQALQQQLGREPSQDELAAVTGGRSIRGRETLAARESRVGREFTGEQAELDRALTKGEAALDRELTTDQARLQRALSREELYGGVDVDPRRGTLAAREADAARRFARGESALEREQRGTLASQERALRGRLSAAEIGSREKLAEGEITSREEQAALDRTLAREGTTEQSRLQEINLYGRELSEAERGMIASGRGGPSTVAAKELAQRGEQFGQELTSREDMAAQERALRGRLSAAEIGSREGLAARDITSREDQNRLQRALAREELYGGVDVDPRRGTLASRHADRAAGFERERLGYEGERIGLARDAGEREAFRNQLAEEELYGTSQRRGDTFASREARQSRTERQDRYALEDQRYDAATALEAERYDTSRQDYETDRRMRDEDREWQRQMDVFGARRAQEAVGGRFSISEEDFLARSLDPNYKAPTAEGWEQRNPAPERLDFPEGDAGVAEWRKATREWQNVRNQREAYDVHERFTATDDPYATPAQTRDNWLRDNPKPTEPLTTNLSEDLIRYNAWVNQYSTIFPNEPIPSDWD